ncbi:hypothetical protein, partial [Salmonella sp. s54836]|uniref:hypothetical protein n=1 Tax=Salmonella sp. s54836 TaxID=3159673 RepID=UPI00397F5725
LNPNDLTSQAKGEATVSPNRAALASSSSLGNISLGEMAIFAVIGMFIILTVLVVIILIVCLVYRIKTRKNPRPLEGRRTAALNPAAFGNIQEDPIYSSPGVGFSRPAVTTTLPSAVRNPFYTNPTFLDS